MTSIVQYLVEKYILSVVHHLGNVGEISCAETAMHSTVNTRSSADADKPARCI